jgi:hypothetical protein
VRRAPGHIGRLTFAQACPRFDEDVIPGHSPQCPLATGTCRGKERARGRRCQAKRRMAGMPGLAAGVAAVGQAPRWPGGGESARSAGASALRGRRAVGTA